MLAVRLPSDIEQRIADLASRTGRTKTFYVREAIESHLDELEDKYLALDRLEKPVKRWSLEDMEGGLDLDR
ncbi:MAG: TraY domain-containing protein [Oceanobacter sp.]